jgi:C_GCAxxG_C_C family probable redox protein
MSEYQDAKTLSVRFFDSGFNCAESLNLAFAPADANLTRVEQMAATPFGGGLVRRGELCGALAGAAMVIGRELGRSSPDDSAGKDRAYRVVEELLTEFEARYGTIACRTITNCDFRQPHDEAEMKRLHEQVCAPLVRFVAELVERAALEAR